MPGTARRSNGVTEVRRSASSATVNAAARQFATWITAMIGRRGGHVTGAGRSRAGPPTHGTMRRRCTTILSGSAEIYDG